MPHTSFKQKTLLLTLSLLLNALILESILNAAGLFFLLQNKKENQLSKILDQSVRILCIGESTTFIGGKDSYPSQLETILNQTKQSKHYEVINKGLPGKNMDDIYVQLEGWIKNYQPHLVVAMMGINDEAFLVPFQKKTNNKNAPPFLNSLKITKLFIWLHSSLFSSPDDKKNPSFTDLNSKFASRLKKADLKKYSLYKQAVSYLQNNDQTHAEILLRQLLNSLNQDSNISLELKPMIYLELGELFLKQNRHDALEEIFKYFFETDSLMLHTRHFLQKTCGNQALAKKTIPLLLSIEDDKPNSIFLFDLLSHCYSKTNNQKLSKEYFMKSFLLRQNLFSPYSKKKYSKIARLLFNKNVPLIAMQYPLRNIEALKHILKNEAHFESILWVENKENFLKALEGRRYKDYFHDRFASDFGHCTKKGNRLIAQQLADTILEKF